VLRSPLFAATDEDLIALALEKQGSWYKRLQKIGPSQAADQPLARAAQLIERWRSIGATLPLHDLLDQIYHEGSVIARYSSAARPWQRPQMLANLRRLLDLALEIDSGRYPSLSRFLNRLTELQNAGSEAPSETTPQQGQSIVEILTVHQSKGLEAPVIFFCNLASKPMDDKAWSTMVDWPADADRPCQFLLQPRTADIDSVSQKSRNAWKIRQQTEAANLLYVALTRAKQMLVLSASETTASSKQENRYQQLKRLLEPLGDTNEEGRWHYQQGEIPTWTKDTEVAPEATIEPHPGLRKSFSLAKPLIEIAPSKVRTDKTSHKTRQADAGDIREEDSLPRGIAIHRFLELLSTTSEWQDEALHFQVAAELDLQPENPVLTEWLDEAKASIRQFPDVFAGDYIQALNETPILYTLDKDQVYGLIDRLLIYPDKIRIIDYKTHRLEKTKKSHDLTQYYQQQMSYYATGLQKVYPDHEIEALLLLTHTQQLQTVDLENEIPQHNNS
jgi:ATP-dependent helicase/nuclease subunit A